MADGEDFKKKILLEVEAKTDTLKQNAASLNQTLDELKAKLKETGELSGKNTKEYQAQASAVRLAQVAVRDNNRELDNATRAYKATSNSIEQNRALVSTLTAAHVKLTQAEGEGSNAAKVMEAQLKLVNDVLMEQEKRYGDTRRKVGSYQEAVDSLKNSHTAATGGLNSLTNKLNDTATGFGFMPTAISSVTSSFMGFVETQKQVVQGFQQHTKLIEIANKAQEEAVVATEAATKATIGFTFAKEKLAAGEITEAEASAAATVASEANATATIAQTTATQAATAATEAGTTATKLLKIALASTGIGLLVIALGTLVVWFNNTNEGAKKLKVVMAEIGAVFQEVLKLIAPLGKALFDTFANSEGPIRLVSGLLRQCVLPLATLVTLIGDIAHGEFKKAFEDGASAIKQFGTNVKDIIVGTGETVITLSKNVVKASSEISASSKNFKDVAKEAAAITVERQGLTKAERLWSEEKLKQQGILDLLKLKIRDVSTTEKERIAVAKEAKIVSDNIFKTNLANAETNFKLVEREQALNSKKDYQAITDAKNRVQELKNAHEVEIQSIQNREAKVENILNKKNEKQLTAQQKLLIAQSKGYTEAENILMQSQTRQLQLITETYATEILTAEQHYKDELTKLKKLQADKVISLKEFNKVSAQLLAEYHGKVERITTDFNRSELEKERAAANELQALRVNNIANNEKRELASADLTTKTKLEALKKENDQIQIKINQINEEKKTASGEVLRTLELELNTQQDLLGTNGDKVLALTEASEKARLNIVKKYAQQRKIAQDEKEVKAAKKKSTVFDSSGEENAEKKLIIDKYAFEIEQAKGNSDEIQRLTTERDEAISANHKKFVKERADFELQAASQVANAAGQIIAQNIRQNSERKLADLDKQKSAELKNTSLTTTQKQIIETKYQKKQNEEKVKAFKANQKLAIAMALINGAIAVVKTFADLGWPAGIIGAAAVAVGTALEVATIAKQKPPAFARGGRFISDGRGAKLNGPGTGTSDSINARLSHGESIINARSTSLFLPLLDQINQYGGGRALVGDSNGSRRFAMGGLFTDNSSYLPSVDNGLRANQINITASSDMSDISNSINNLPGAISSAMAGVNIVTDIKDVSYQQQIMSRTENRVIL